MCNLSSFKWTLFIHLIVLSTTAYSQERYAGIEIGSKGVKQSIVSFTPGGAPEFSPGVISNSGLVAGEFSGPTCEATIEAIDTAYKDLIKTIPRDRIYIVASSGLVGTAVRTGKKDVLDNLMKDIQTRTENTVIELSVEEEVRLAFLAIVPSSRRSTSLMIDIGGGNTKYGAEVDGKFVYGEVPVGSSSAVAQVQKAVQEGKASSDVLESLRQDFTKQLRASAVEKLQGRHFDHVYLVGGIVWAMVNFEQPSDFPKSPSKIAPQSFSSFQTRSMTKDSYAPPAIDTTHPDPKKLEKELAEVMKAFPQENAQAGAVLLNGVRDVFGLGTTETSVWFDRQGVYAWIRGYIKSKNPAIDAMSDLQDRLQELQTELSTVRASSKQSDSGESAKVTKAIDDGFKLVVAEMKNRPTTAPVPLPAKLDIGLGELTAELKTMKVDLQPLVDAVKELKATKSIQPPPDTKKVEVNPGRTQLSSSNDVSLAWELFHRGRSKYWDHKLVEAKQELVNACQLAPSEPVFWYFLALVELESNDPHGAEASAMECARLHRNDYRQSTLYRELERVQGSSRMAIENLMQRGRAQFNGARYGSTSQKSGLN